MLSTVAASFLYPSMPTPAQCCYCGRNHSIIPSATEMLTSKGWQRICLHCEGGLDRKRPTAFAEMYPRAKWISVN